MTDHTDAKQKNTRENRRGEQASRACGTRLARVHSQKVSPMARPPATLAARPSRVTPPLVPFCTGRSVVISRGCSGLRGGGGGACALFEPCRARWATEARPGMPLLSSSRPGGVRLHACLAGTDNAR